MSNHEDDDVIDLSEFDSGLSAEDGGLVGIEENDAPQGVEDVDLDDDEDDDDED